MNLDLTLSSFRVLKMLWECDICFSAETLTHFLKCNRCQTMTKNYFQKKVIHFWDIFLVKCHRPDLISEHLTYFYGPKNLLHTIPYISYFLFSLSNILNLFKIITYLCPERLIFFCVKLMREKNPFLAWCFFHLYSLKHFSS